VLALGGGDDPVRVLGPAEGARICVGLRDEAVDRLLERDEGMKHPALDTRLMKS
jgi:hypothetical protein